MYIGSVVLLYERITNERVKNGEEGDEKKKHFSALESVVTSVHAKYTLRLRIFVALY